MPYRKITDEEKEFRKNLELKKKSENEAFKEQYKNARKIIQDAGITLTPETPDDIALSKTREKQGFKMARLLLGLKQTRKPRQKKDKVLTNAEKQKQYKERQKAMGNRQINIWVKDTHPYIKIHEKSINACQEQPGLKTLLSKFTDTLLDEAAEGNISEEVCQDIIGFFKVLGINNKI